MYLNTALLYLIAALGSFSAIVSAPANNPKASWSVLVYMAADNSLASFASYNIDDMAKGLSSTHGVNVLVQWDKPEDTKTWRYQITPGGKVDAGTLSSEMGYNPEAELVKAMQWVVEKYPAEQYAVILWDHGSGVLDFDPGATKTISSPMRWLDLLPMDAHRGVLYDDSQNTCLTNAGLRSALEKINHLLGKKLDVIAMDACLMAMVEVTYQMKDLVSLFVCSQQTIPGDGYPYSKFIKPLSTNPTSTTPLALATDMVSSYKEFYSTEQPTSDFTLAALDVTGIERIKENIDHFIDAVMHCYAIDAEQTKKMIMAARAAAIHFDMAEYIDLYSLYAQVLQQIKQTSPKSSVILANQHISPKLTVSAEYKQALDTLSTVVTNGLTYIIRMVLKKAAGPAYAGAQGISIYYPSNGVIDDSYKQTLFAQNSQWISFVQLFS